ncbi:glycohydrolase toxin TNT-related protein [Microbacterium sp. NPDC089698]|uniref:glycohydrolase toxin TNT-related protein n=1 Tax=Microbacterium sp. NPDC089698 TaxID=3364200 RepID=UPI00381F2B43
MTPPNPLVAGPVNTTSPLQGTFLLEDGEALVSAIKSGDWVAGGFAAFGAVMDTVAAVSDPLGSLIAAGLGWLMEHLQPLKGWLNDLTGDSGAVAGFAQTWTNVGTQLRQSAGDLATVLGDLDAADGAAVQAYLAFQRDVVAHLKGAASWADGLATGMQMASTIVQVVHDMVRDALAQLVGSLISYAAELVLSLGLATPLVIEQASTRVAALATKFSKKIPDMVAAIRKLGDLVEKLKALFTRFGDTADSLLKGGKHGPDGPKHGPDGAPPKKPTIDEIRAKSTLSDAELEKYLRKQYGDDVADAYAKDGRLPDDVQIPKDSSVLNPDGSIDWSQVPKGGYELTPATVPYRYGDPIKDAHSPSVGDVVDRYGPDNGRYTSPVPENGPYSYDQRSLPYVENPNHYHQYEFADDLDSVRSRYDQAPPEVQAKVDELIDKGYYQFGQQAGRGPIAEGFGSHGGGTQIELPLPVDVLVDLGVLARR